MSDRMLSDEILLGIINSKSGGGGGGGTDDYNDLKNQPKINNNTLVGNKTASDLGLVAAETGKGLSTNDYTDADKAIVGGVTAALAGKQDALTAGSHIAIDDDTISVNRWAVPAGKVVYTVITSDENYGQNVHVQRHTLGGAFIDDRTFTCASYQTVNVDDLIRIQNPYANFNITLLEDSDEQQAGYSYTVNPISTPTSNSFTFLMEQEENANDLIIRSELDAEVNAIKDGTSIDSFSDVETALATKQNTLTFDDVPTDNSNNPVKSNGIYDALALKQNATDNTLQTTDKTVVGAINEHEGDISSLKSGLTNYQTQNDINLEVPNRKNILNLSFEKIKALCNEGTWTGTSYVYNGVTFVFTVVDGYITKISISGTLTDNRSRVWIAYNEDITNYNGCILNGCPDLGGTDYISIQIQKTGTPYTTYAVDTGSGANINNISNNCQIYISIGASFDSQTPVDVYPMIRPATITDPTFAPYIPSVESRIEAVESGLTNNIFKSRDIISATTSAGAITTYGFIQHMTQVYVMIPVNKPISATSFTVTDIESFFVRYDGHLVDALANITNITGQTVLSNGCLQFAVNFNTGTFSGVEHMPAIITINAKITFV